MVNVYVKAMCHVMALAAASRGYVLFHCHNVRGHAYPIVLETPPVWQDWVPIGQLSDFGAPASMSSHLCLD